MEPASTSIENTQSSDSALLDNSSSKHSDTAYTKKAVEANALLVSGEPAEAYPLVCAIAKRSDATDEQMMLAGCLAVTLDKQDEAVDWFKIALQNDPTNPNAYHNLALVYFRQGQYAVAAEVFGAAYDIGVADSAMLRDLGVTFAQLAQFKPALDSICESIRLAENPEESFTALMELCFDAKESRRAKRYLKVWRKAQPEQEFSQWQTRVDQASSIDISESKTTTVKGVNSGLISELLDAGAQKKSDDSSSSIVTGKKIAFFATQPSFLAEIITDLSVNNETRSFQQGSVGDMKRMLEWCDVAWFDWCDSLLIQATNHLPKLCPIICRLHSYEAFTEMPSQVDWSKVDNLVFVNESVKHLMTGRIPSSVVCSIAHNAVDLKKFQIPAGKKYGKKIASVGYINYKKNPQLLLYCFKAIHDWDPEFELHIAGKHQDSRIELYMRDMAQKLGIDIHYHGWIEDMPAFYQEMDYVISTSLFESFHLSIAEGMASGVIPLVHDWFGADNIYPDTCRYLTPEDCLSLVKKSIEGDRAEQAKAYRAHIESNFGLQKQVKEIANVIKSTIESPDASIDKSVDLGLVSIVIPTYNRADYLPEALSSALSQTYPHCEIVVVDDGSTDNTQEVLAKYKSEYPDKITIITQENKGVSAALNSAIKHSKGEYISWLSSDDAYHPDKVWENIKVLANKPQLGWVYGDFFYMTAQSQLKDRANVTPLENATFVDDMFKGNPIHGCSVMFRKSVLDKTDYFDESLGGKIGYGADGALWHKMGYHFEFEFIPKALVYYRLHPGQVTHQADIPKSQKEYQQYMQDYFERQSQAQQTTIAQPGPRECSMGSTERLGYEVDPDFPEEKPGGKRILWIGTADPCGNAAMYARAINRHTEHLCRVVTFKETRGFDRDIALRLHDSAGNDPINNQLTRSEDERLRSLAEKADVLVFSASTYAGSASGNSIVDDTDGMLWGKLDWADYSAKKPCVAFFFGSTATRMNADWYHNHFVNDKKWRIATGQLDLKRRWDDASYVPTWLDIDAERYKRIIEPSKKTLVVQTPTDPPIKNSAELEKVVRELSSRYTNVALAIKTGLSYEESLNLKRQGQIALDQMQVNDGYYCMSSLENSALGLVNFVYVDKFGRNKIAETLRTDTLPWRIVRNESELKAGIEALLKAPDKLLQLQQETYDWMREYWRPSRLVHHLTSAILGE